MLCYMLDNPANKSNRKIVGSDLKAVSIDKVVGAEGFEPPTLCSQSRCATRLRYAPISIKTCEPPYMRLGAEEYAFLGVIVNQISLS